MSSLIKDILKDDKKQTKLKKKQKQENYNIPIVFNDIPSIEETFKKSNRIIKGKSNIKSTKHSHNLGNFLYREMNLRMVKNNGVLEKNEISIPLIDMKKTLKISGKGYDTIIKEAMENLQEGKIELDKYTDKQGRTFDYVVMSLISGFDREKLPSGEVIYNIEVSKKMMKFLNENSSGSYTIIHNKYTAILSGVKQIKLYEYCKQYVGFNGGVIKNLTLEKLNIIFQSDYKYLSKAKEQMVKSIKGINTKTDITIAFIEQDNKKVIELLVVENERAVKDRQQQKKRKEMLDKSKGQDIYIFKHTEEEQEIISNLSKGEE
ncbi:replication initiation protein [Sulfurimonas sp. NWX367]|uniref:replication initiation protein n=1 Tax=unclassified Sulfurimonas TaxID=2623549 RepID=UPI003204ED42